MNAHVRTHNIYIYIYIYIYIVNLTVKPLLHYIAPSRLGERAQLKAAKNGHYGYETLTHRKAKEVLKITSEVGFCATGGETKT